METFDNSLQIGSVLDGRYKIQSVLGEGGFGITYKAYDQQLEYVVVIKEFLPQECAARAGNSITVQPRTNRSVDYEYGLQRFLDEARALAKFQHQNIVRISNFIQANATAYFVMDYADGIDLSEWLKKRNERLDEATILKIITPVLKGLAEVHKVGLLHRDIKPGNIFLRKTGGPMLIDFGAARHALGEHSKSISAIISLGFAPPEQYTSRGKQGAFTDLYAIGATLYQLITGTTPVESIDRSHAKAEGDADPLIPAIEAGKDKVSEWLLKLTDQLLNISIKDRPQNCESVLLAIQNKTSAIVDVDSTEENSHSTDKTRVVNSNERFAKQANNSTTDADLSKQRNRGKNSIITAVLLAIIMIGGGWWYSSTSTNIASQENESIEVSERKPDSNLISGKAVLYIDSQPSGADVYLDDDKIGTTPYNGDNLPSGKHILKLTHNIYADQTDEINLQNDVILKKSYSLKIANGNLSIFSQPDGAHIFIDGKDTEQITPATVENIIAGQRQIKLQKDKFYDLIENVQVVKLKTIRAEFSLKGGNLVKYQGKWVAPEDRDKLIAKLKRNERVAKTDKRASNNLIKAKAKHTKVKKTHETPRQRIKRLVGKVIHIPAGSFQMGSNDGESDEKPMHYVQIKGFKLGKNEVTQKLWQEIMGENFSNTLCDNCPVEMVSWDDTQSFIKKLNRKTGQRYRLPTESEWEYACRSGGKEEIYCGSNDEESSIAWYRSNSDSQIHTVGNKKSNALGLHDMSGNVWEWVQDCYNDSYREAPSSNKVWQQKDCEHRVMRGGSWDYGPYYLRSTARYGGVPSFRSINYGFRIAHD